VNRYFLAINTLLILFRALFNLQQYYYYSVSYSKTSKQHHTTMQKNKDSRHNIFRWKTPSESKTIERFLVIVFSLLKENNYIKFSAITERGFNPLSFRLQLVGCYYTLITCCNRKNAPTPCKSNHNLTSAPTLFLPTVFGRMLRCPVIYQPQLKILHNVVCRPRLE